MNLGKMFEDACSTYKDNTALVFEDSRIRYKDLNGAVSSLANHLKSLGIGKGDKVALMLPNVPEFPITYFACQKLGAVAVTLNVMSTSYELQYLLDNSDSKVLITAATIGPPLRGDQGQARHLQAPAPDRGRRRAPVHEESPRSGTFRVRALRCRGERPGRHDLHLGPHGQAPGSRSHPRKPHLPVHAAENPVRSDTGRQGIVPDPSLSLLRRRRQHAQPHADGRLRRDARCLQHREHLQDHRDREDHLYVRRPASFPRHAPSGRGGQFRRQLPEVLRHGRLGHAAGLHAPVRKEVQGAAPRGIRSHGGLARLLRHPARHGAEAGLHRRPHPGARGPHCRRRRPGSRPRGDRGAHRQGPERHEGLLQGRMRPRPWCFATGGSTRGISP